MDDHPKIFLVHGSGSILLYEMKVPRKCFLLYRNGAEQTSYLLQKGKWAKINLNVKGVEAFLKFQLPTYIWKKKYLYLGFTFKELLSNMEIDSLQSL